MKSVEVRACLLLAASAIVACSTAGKSVDSTIAGDVSPREPVDGGAIAPNHDAADGGAPFSDASVDAAGRRDAGSSLPSGLFRLAGTDASLPDDDLAPVTAIADSAEILGVGESIHTSGGFHAMRERIVEDLVKNHGYRAVALETALHDAEVTTRYVERGEGTSSDALRGMFGVFASVEMQRTLEFLSAWNASHSTDKVAYFGFDVQEPWNNVRLVTAWLDKTVPSERASLVDPVIAACIGAEYADASAFYSAPEINQVFSGATFFPADAHAKCVSALAAIAARVGTTIGSGSDVELAYAQIALRSMQFFEDHAYYLYAAPGIMDYPRGAEARDHGMANNLTDLRQLHGGVKVFIIAHNTHLMADGENGIHRMGSFLAETWGDKYAPLAQIAFRTEINWPGVAPPADPAADSVEVVLNPFADALFFDLRSSSNRPLLLPGRTYQMSWLNIVPANSFRGAIFLRYSPPMVRGK
jgi:erythromycin esterase-like protein